MEKFRRLLNKIVVIYRFIARKNKKQVYVQVSYYMNTQKTIEREFKLLENIKDNYSKYISMDKIDYSRNGIIHLNIIDFLLNGID